MLRRSRQPKTTRAAPAKAFRGANESEGFLTREKAFDRIARSLSIGKLKHAAALTRRISIGSPLACAETVAAARAPAAAARAPATAATEQLQQPVCVISLLLVIPELLSY
jgi:2-methylaconitate cis-trans-isomerase PrpF